MTVFICSRITLYFGTFELRMEITSQLRYVFAGHFCYVTITLFICLLQLRFLMTLELRYILVRSD